MYETSGHIILEVIKKLHTWYQLVALHFEPNRNRDGRMDDGTKGKCSYGKYIGQRNTMPSYCVLQAQDTHAIKQNTMGKIANEDKSKRILYSSGKISMVLLFVWDRSIGGRFIRRYAALYFRSSMPLFFLLESLMVTSTVDVQGVYYKLGFDIPVEIASFEPTFSHMQVTKLIYYYCSMP